MSGIMEILLIVAIIVGIFMLPRLMARKPERELQLPVHRSVLTGRMRFAILLSLLWPVVVAFFMEPWNGSWPLFFYIAVGPVALIWGIYWVFSGFRRERR
jgi:Na+/H+ antiporter NhaD/arsenite permease-like protein